MKYTDTVIIGSGQAGLATSYFLKQQGNEHVILEKASQPANNWREHCWDSFNLVTPNWAFRLPGMEYKGEDREGYMPRQKVIEAFDRYIREFDLPVKYNTEVISVEKVDQDGYVIQTNRETYRASNVVVATGLCQSPRIPKYAAEFSSDIRQMHSSEYRNPDLLPSGAVLIVGSGQSGSQIAEELYNAGRKVFLSVGTAGRVPRRYRGKDIIEWLEIAGFFNLTPEQLPPGMTKFHGIPHITGANGGYTINLHQFAKKGITLLGHLRGAENKKAKIAPDLYESLAKVDTLEKNVVMMIDEYIRANKLDLPAEEITELKDGYSQPLIEELDLDKENIKTIIWAAGYKYDYSFIKLPVQDQDGFPIQRSGVTDYRGLYFVGMPWMPSEKSGFLVGVAESAKHIASQIVKIKEPA